jgi:hypothetical protein
MQALWKFVDIEQHGTQHIEKLTMVIGRTFFYHEPHGLQHGGQARVLVTNGLKGAVAVHENSPEGECLHFARLSHATS